MRNLKKFLALSLAVVMLFGFASFATAKTPDDFTDADASEAFFESKGDYADEYRAATQLMIDLGIAVGSDGNLNLSEKLTKEAFFVLLYKCSVSATEPATFYGTYAAGFKDVSWSRNYIGWAVMTETASGESSTHFGASRTFHFADALFLVLRRLGVNTNKEPGYATASMTTEGRQMWAMALAADPNIDIIGNLNPSDEKLALTRGEAFLLMSYMLHADRIGYNASTGERVYGTAAGTPANFLSTVFKLETFEGAVVATPFTGAPSGKLVVVDENGDYLLMPAGNIGPDALGRVVYIEYRAKATAAAGYDFEATDVYAFEYEENLTVSYAARADVDALITYMTGTGSNQLGYTIAAGAILYENYVPIGAYVNSTDKFTDNGRATGAATDPGTTVNIAASVKAGDRVRVVWYNKVVYGVYVEHYTYNTIKTVASSDGALTTAKGTTTDVLNAVAKSKIYGYYSGIKAGDQVLVYKIGSNFGILPLDAVTGKITRLNGESSFLLDGKTYNYSTIPNASNYSNIKTDCLTKEYTYYVLNGYLIFVDIPSTPAAPATYGLIVGSKYSPADPYNQTAAKYTVKLMDTDGKTTEYELAAIMDNGDYSDPDPTNHVAPAAYTLGFSSSNINYTPAANAGAAYTGKTNPDGLLFRYTISSGKVTLYEIENAAAATGVTTAEMKLNAGSFPAAFGGLSGKNIASTAKTFIKQSDGTYKLYTGATLPGTDTGANNLVSSMYVLANLNGTITASGNYLRLAVFDPGTAAGTKAFAATSASSDMIYVISNDGISSAPSDDSKVILNLTVLKPDGKRVEITSAPASQADTQALSAKAAKGAFLIPSYNTSGELTAATAVTVNDMTGGVNAFSGTANKAYISIYTSSAIEICGRTSGTNAAANIREVTLASNVSIYAINGADSKKLSAEEIAELGIDTDNAYTVYIFGSASGATAIYIDLTATPVSNIVW